VAYNESITDVLDDDIFNGENETPEGDDESQIISSDGMEISDEDIEVKPAPPPAHGLSFSDAVAEEAREVAVFLEKYLYPALDENYRELSGEYKERARFIMDILMLARVHGLPLGSFPIGVDSISKAVPMLADEVQSRLNLYRPTGKAAQNKKLAEYLLSRSDKDVIYIDGDTLSTAYTVIGGNEEFLMLKIDKRRVSELHFREGGKLNKKIIPPQSKMVDNFRLTMRWDQIRQIISVPVVVLDDNGHHPDYSKATSTALIGGKHINRVQGPIGQAILELSLRDLKSSMELAKNSGIDPNSISETMENAGFTLSDDLKRFIPPDNPRQTKQEAPPKQEKPQQPAMVSKSEEEKASLLRFLE
jgi:hypothetical protein